MSHGHVHLEDQKKRERETAATSHSRLRPTHGFYLKDPSLRHSMYLANEERSLKINQASNSAAM
jgi:hypothetical protein